MGEEEVTLPAAEDEGWGCTVHPTEVRRNRNTDRQLRETVQDRKARPNVHADLSQVSPGQALGQNKTVSVYIRVASFGQLVRSFRRQHVSIPKNVEDGAKGVSYCFLNAGFQC